MKKQLGFIGLGKMGTPMVLRLKRKGWKVETFDVNGKGGAKTIAELAETLIPPRIVWLMVPAFAKATAGKPAGKPVDDVLRELAPRLDKGDIVIDGGNSYYKDSMRRSKKLNARSVYFLDVGISGGPVSIKIGKFAIMAGGEKRIYEKCSPIFRDLSDTRSGYMGKSGAGHFAKMIHNGIEYGMMQALAEGFTILKKAPFRFSLRDIANVYNSNSIITSRLVGWLEQGFKKYGDELKQVSGTVAYTGEGEWTVKTAKELKVLVPVIQEAFEFRVQSKKKPSYTGKILSMLRAVFGGHAIR